jgi:hypothetical protein
MDNKDWIMTIAVLLAPLAALQVQKMIEAWKEVRQKKRWIYVTLMTTRHAQLSFDHVRALNMIDLEFTGSSNKDDQVRVAWKAYLDQLGALPKEDDQPAMAVWDQQKTELFAKLLEVMGYSVGYKFDLVHIKRGIYAPRGHFNDELEQRATRRMLLEMLSGDRPLKIHTVLVPLNEAAGEEGKKFIHAIQEVCEGKRSLNVTIAKSENDGGVVR